MEPTPLDYAAWRASALGATTERLERAAVLDLAGPIQDDPHGGGRPRLSP